jgi:pimeloyl-ACP methyl ester carboxylesterase
MVQMAYPAFAAGGRLPPFMRLMMVGTVRRILNGLPPNERVGRSMLRQIGHAASLDAGRIPPAFLDWYLALQKYADTMRTDGDLIRRVGTIRGFDPSLTITDDLPGSLPTPTLFLWGTEDAFGGGDVARALVAAMPDAELVLVPGAGHLPWLDFPEQLGQVAADFLADG